MYRQAIQCHCFEPANIKDYYYCCYYNYYYLKINFSEYTMMMHNERGGRVETRGSLIDEGNGNKRRLGHTGDKKKWQTRRGTIEKLRECGCCVCESVTCWRTNEKKASC